jgi:anti-sigma B factor antagonist
VITRATAGDHAGGQAAGEFDLLTCTPLPATLLCTREGTSVSDQEVERLRVTVVDGVLHLDGEVDIATVGDLDRVLTGLREAPVSVADGPSTIVVNMAGVTFMDSMGVRALLKAARNGGLRVEEPSEQLRQLFSLAGVAEALGVEPA